jgi:toxin FitB
MWLLDTVTLSELTKSNANDAVLEWLTAQPRATLFTSVICVGELRYGVERLAPGQRRDRMRAWLANIISDVLQGRIVGFDEGVAQTWAEARVFVPRTLPILDTLIAATALNRGFTIVTRNVKDFSAFGVDVFDPWESN